MTAEKFILEPKYSGERTASLYTQFRHLMAQKLGYPSIDSVEIVSLLDRDGYLEVRYTAHASPYISPAQTDSVVIMYMQEVSS